MNTEDHIPFVAPPPAYSEQEFDQKIVHATQLSLERHATDGEEEWEEWDEAKFEAAARNLSLRPSNKKLSSPVHGNEHRKGQGSSSHLVEQIRPLYIQKKTQLPEVRKGEVDVHSQNTYAYPSSHIPDANRLGEDRKLDPPLLYRHARGYSHHVFPHKGLEGRYEPQPVPPYHPAPLSQPELLQAGYSSSSSIAPNTPHGHLRSGHFKFPEEQSMASYAPSTFGAIERYGTPGIKFHPSSPYRNSSQVEDPYVGNRSNGQINAASFYNAAVSAHLSTPVEFISRPPNSPSRSPVLQHYAGDSSASHIRYDHLENRPTRYPKPDERSFTSWVDSNGR